MKSEPNTQRLVQPWQSNQWDKLLSSPSGQQQGDSTLVAVGGIPAVLILAMVAQAVESGSAGMAVTAAAWGFLALAHVSHGSASPRWSSLLPLLPLTILIGLGMFFGTGETDSYVVLKRLGELTGLAAFGTAIHLTMRRESVYRRALLDAMILGILFVVISCVSRVFAHANPETGPLTIDLVVGVLSTQADLITMALLCLCIGIGMVLESLEDAGSHPLPILIALLPLSLPLYASRYGSAITAVLIAIAVVCLIFRHFRNLRAAHPVTILIGIALLGVSAAHASFMTTTEPTVMGLDKETLWETVRLHPFLGRPGTHGINAPAEFLRLLLDYGFGGLALLSLTLAWYVRGTWHSNSPRPILSWWCWIGCLMVGWISLWETPLDHPIIALMTILLLVSSMASGNLEQRQRRAPSPGGIRA